MDDRYLYKITVTPLRAPEDAPASPGPFSFEVTTRDDLIRCIESVQASALQRVEELPALIVGLKLLGDIAARSGTTPLDGPVRQALAALLERNS